MIQQKLLFRWICEPSGFCPRQAEGYFLGKWFYFRARGERATIEFHECEQDFWDSKKELAFYILCNTQWPKAGYLPKWKCKLLIFKGLLKFLIYGNRKDNSRI